MNTPDPPINPDHLDELISADLDGELDRAASELGYPAPAVRAAFATAAASRRRVALAQARERLGVIPALGPDDSRRLVLGALARTEDDLARARAQHATRRRFAGSGRVLIAVGSAAAAIAVVFALASTANNSGSSKSSAASAPITLTPPPGPAPKSAAPLDLGNVSHPGVLRSKAAAALKHAVPQFATISPGATNTPSVPLPEVAGSPDGPTTTVADSAEGAGHAQDLASDAGRLAMAAPRGLVGYDDVVVNAPNAAIATGHAPAAAGIPAARSIRPTCIAATARAAGLAAPVVTGSAAYAGRPAIVVVFRKPPAYVAYLLSVPGCAVIAHVSVP